MKTAIQKQTWKIKLNLGNSEVEGLRRKLVPWRGAFFVPVFFLVSLAIPFSFWGQILEGSKGRVAGRGG